MAVNPEPIEGPGRQYCNLCHQTVESWGPWCKLYTDWGRYLCPPLLHVLQNAMDKVERDLSSPSDPLSPR
jgi:hypothetical protein